MGEKVKTEADSIDTGNVDECVKFVCRIGKELMRDPQAVRESPARSTFGIMPGMHGSGMGRDLAKAQISKVGIRGQA